MLSPSFTIADPLALRQGESGMQDTPGTINNFPDMQDDLAFDFGLFAEPTSVNGVKVSAESSLLIQFAIPMLTLTLLTALAAVRILRKSD